MKVLTRNDERTIQEMQDMWTWMVTTFGKPGEDSNYTWRYGKDTPGYAGSMFIDGPWDIEYFDFNNSKDAEWYILRWL